MRRSDDKGVSVRILHLKIFTFRSFRGYSLPHDDNRFWRNGYEPARSPQNHEKCLQTNESRIKASLRHSGQRHCFRHRSAAGTHGRGQRYSIIPDGRSGTIPYDFPGKCSTTSKMFNRFFNPLEGPQIRDILTGNTSPSPGAGAAGATVTILILSTVVVQSVIQGIFCSFKMRNYKLNTQGFFTPSAVAPPLR
jgi:hypothetical protein